MSRTVRRLTAPANLLLAGEYAVTEEGGLGIGIAVEVRATLVRRDGPPRLRGILPGQDVEYPGSGGLFGKMAHQLFGDSLPDELGDVTIDTTAFFGPDGAKLGFGSSAALAVLLAACFVFPHQATLDEVFGRALAAHRAVHGGIGSGYDIACSTYGGILLFTGGRSPTARRIDLPWLPPFRVHRGEAPVATQGAMDRYTVWKSRNPGQAAEYIERSNELVRAICAAPSWSTGGSLISEYARHAMNLGRAIGVPATPPARLTGVSSGGPAEVMKCVGAGDELAVSFHPEPGSITTAGAALAVATDGLLWE